jgi:hypothetical protein
MIGIEDHLVGNGDRQEIVEVHQEDLGVEEVEVVVEGIEMVVVMEEEVVVVEGEGLHLEVLRPRELFHWKRGRLSIHSGIFDPCNSKESVPWPLK